MPDICTPIGPGFLLGEASLQDLLDRIAADPSIASATRSQWCCSLRRVAAFLGRHPKQLPARLSGLRQGITRLHHAKLGIARKTLQNHLANLKAAIRYGGQQELAGVQAALSPQWSSFVDILVSTRHRRGLSSFVRYCSTSGIVPAEVDDSTLTGFIEWRQETGFVNRPRDLHKLVGRIWNEAVVAYPQWPQRLLTVPDFRAPARRLPWDRFPHSLVEDIERYCQYLAGNILDDDGPERPCKSSTLKNRRERIRLAASAAVRSGVPVDTLRSLADLVTPSTVKAILEYYLAEKGGEVTVFIADLAGLLTSIAKIWCRSPEQELSQLKRYRRRLDQKRPKGMTEKNMAVIRQVLDDETWQRVRDLPSRLMDEALAEATALKRAAVKAQKAVAIQILIVAPIRIGNLAAISIDENLVRPAGPDGPIHLVFPDYDVKNGVPLEFPLPDKVARMIDLYRTRFRHFLRGSNEPWLFPGPLGTHKVPRTLSQQISEALWKDCGLKMTAHQFRHAAAAIILKNDPGNYELVRRVLVHKNQQTSVNAYIGLESVDAARLFSRIALGEDD